jgi:hypothetical protein
MMTPAIVPTVTQRVRAFLADQGAELRPWSGLQETYDQLYGLLRKRRQDPEFWAPLKGLLREVVASAADSQMASTAHAELLASWKVDELVDELRDALPADASSARTDFTRSLSTAVLGGFLLLGLAAAGCGGDDAEIRMAGTGGALGTGGGVTLLTGTGGAMGTGGATATLPGTGGSGVGGATPSGTGGAVGTGGNAAGGVATGGAAAGSAAGSTGGLDAGTDASIDVALDDTGKDTDLRVDDASTGEAMGIDGATRTCTQSVAAEVESAIGGSTLAPSKKTQLCECFAALSKDWTTSLTQLFATATPQQISSMLSGLSSCCDSRGLHILPSMSKETALSYIKTGQGYWVCNAPLYKGVSFSE